MRTPEEKYRLMEEQLIGKMCWGADANEIRGWLSAKCGISGEEAERLIRMGTAARAAAIRKRAFWEMIGSLVIFAFCGGLMLAQAFGRFIIFGYGALLIYTGLVVSVLWFFQALWRLLTGKTSGPVDKI